MQKYLTGFEHLKRPPLHNNFISYLKTKELSDGAIQKIIHELKYVAEDIGNEPIAYAVAYALETTEALSGDVDREERKRECYYIYKSLENTKMKRSEKVKTIAAKMGVKKDCIQVYLREILSSEN